jgi:hypothetical protein
LYLLYNACTCTGMRTTRESFDKHLGRFDVNEIRSPSDVAQS